MKEHSWNFRCRPVRQVPPPSVSMDTEDDLRCYTVNHRSALSRARNLWCFYAWERGFLEGCGVTSSHPQHVSNPSHVVRGGVWQRRCCW